VVGDIELFSPKNARSVIAQKQPESDDDE